MVFNTSLDVISDADILNALLPAGVDIDPEHRSVIQAAAARIVREDRRIPGAHGRMRALSRIANSLFMVGDDKAFLSMLGSIPEIETERRNTLKLKERSIQRLSQKGRKIRKAGGSESIDDVFHRLRTQRRTMIDFDKAGIEELFGKTDDGIEVMLRNLPIDMWRTPRIERLARAFYGLDEAREMAESDYIPRFVWGLVARALNKALKANITEDLVPLRKAFQALSVNFDSAPLHEAVAHGHSVVASFAHGGISVAEGRAISRAGLGIPKLLITRSNINGIDEMGNLRLGTKDLAATDFLKVVKILKKTPHEIIVYPDGPDGGDRAEFELLGGTVSLGLGAASLAWHSRAETFFVGTRWRGLENIEVYLVTGPVADRSCSREEFEDAFHQFYLSRLREIAVGPPENIGMAEGGIWTSLIASRQNAR